MNHDLRRILRHLLLQKDELEYLILSTPTGPVREILTEANIHLMQSISSLEKTLKYGM